MARSKPPLVRLCELASGQAGDFFALLAEKKPGATRDGKPCPWLVADDESMVATGADIISKETFEDYQLHVEFWLPKYPPDVKGQARGNSGVYLMGRYEIQVLDSFQVPAEKHGCGAIYGKKKPKENACTPPETWQSYDIKFTAPRFDEDGRGARRNNEGARAGVERRRSHDGILRRDLDGMKRERMSLEIGFLERLRHVVGVKERHNQLVRAVYSAVSVPESHHN